MSGVPLLIAVQMDLSARVMSDLGPGLTGLVPLLRVAVARSKLVTKSTCDMYITCP